MERKTKRAQHHAYIGIDPGARGAMAVIDKHCNVLLLEDFPTEPGYPGQLFMMLLDLFPNHMFHAALEKVHSMPKQGVVSTFTFGTNYGMWKGTLYDYEIPFDEPHPQKWMKGIVPPRSGKPGAILVAQRLFPSADLIGNKEPEGRKRKPRDGRADALLIAYWCRKHSIGR